jgi:hypothetical protein
MTDIRIIGAEKTLALDGLNAFVAQREQTMAPLVGIGDGGDNTACSFDLDQDVLAGKFAIVRLKVGATCVVPGDETSVCEGQAYISGTLTDVCVTRPK